MANNEPGYVYILTNPSFREDWVKIVAMANADGGVLAIGVSDKTRRIEGIDGQHSPHSLLS